MKNLIIKLKKEIEEMKTQANKNEEEQNVSRDQIQQLSLAIEDLKMQVSETVREKEKIQAEVRFNISLFSGDPRFRVPFFTCNYSEVLL